MKADSAFFDLAAGGMEVDFERVFGKLKPGAHLLALSPIATHHSNTIGIEDAGMEIRDTVVWVFDSGEPTPEMLMVTVARKPLEGTVAANVLEHGTGALNVDGCRVGGTVETWPATRSYAAGQKQPGHSGDTQPTGNAPSGRWPANLIHDGSDEVVGLFPQSAARPAKAVINGGSSGKAIADYNGIYGRGVGNGGCATGYADAEQSAARFFYSAPRLDSLIAYLLKLITQPNGTVLTNCDKGNLPNDYNYIGQEL